MGRDGPHTAPRKAAGMTAATWITMLSITMFIWGGCVLAVITAIRKEGSKIQG